MALRRFAPLILAAALASCQLGSVNPYGTSKGGSPGSIDIYMYSFMPSSVTVPAGTTVTWMNSDAVAHTVTSTAIAPAFDSGSVASGASYSFIFSAAGSYPYHCTLHAGMTGTVTVTP